MDFLIQLFEIKEKCEKVAIKYRNKLRTKIYTKLSQLTIKHFKNIKGTQEFYIFKNFTLLKN